MNQRDLMVLHALTTMGGNPEFALKEVREIVAARLNDTAEYGITRALDQLAMWLPFAPHKRGKDIVAAVQSIVEHSGKGYIYPEAVEKYIAAVKRGE